MCVSGILRKGGSSVICFVFIYLQMYMSGGRERKESYDGVRSSIRKDEEKFYQG